MKGMSICREELALPLRGFPGIKFSACFYHKEGYLYYLEQLKAQADKCGCLIHAYCLMTNHVHLLITPQEAASASFMMKNLGRCYVQFINRMYKRSGKVDSNPA